jgi:hypothetical protein
LNVNFKKVFVRVGAVSRLLSTYAAAALVLAPFAASAVHPLPENVNVKSFAKVDGGRLELLVRVPLDVVTDLQFPTRGAADYLDLGKVESLLPGVARYWIAGCFEVYEDGRPLPRPGVAETRISAQSDRSFDSFPEALAHFQAPLLAPGTDVFWDQVWLDTRFEYPLHAINPAVAILPKVAGLGVRVTVDLKYVEPGGGTREFSFVGNPGLIYLDARWHDAVKQFLRSGFLFVARSADVLLFLFCLALPLRRWKSTVPAAASLAAALSITLLVSAFDPAPDSIWLRPLTETLSAVGILLAAFANIAGRVTAGGRSLLALGCGAVYGFSGSFDLSSKIQFAGSHAVIGRIAYISGVALTAACAFALLVPVLSALFRFGRSERIEMIVISALAADTAWGWLAERWTRLHRIPFQLPAFDAALILRLLMVFTLLGGALWFARGWFATGWMKSQRLIKPEPSPHDEPPV